MKQGYDVGNPRGLPGVARGEFVGETYSFLPCEPIRACTTDDLVLCEVPTSVRAPQGRIVAGGGCQDSAG